VTFTEIGDGAFTRRYDFFDQNIGVILGGDGVLVIDTRCSHRQAEQVLADVRSLTRLPIRWVVNTHWHWDHTFGNGAFDGVALWGHAAARDTLVSRWEIAKESARADMPPDEQADIDDVVLTPPTEVFTDTATIDIGGRLVGLDHLGLGHTEGDAIVTLSDDPLLWAGDLLEEGNPPWFGDAYPMSWPATVSRMLDRAAGNVVPGHGAVMQPADVAQQHEELGTVAAMAAAGHAEGLAIDAVPLGDAPYPEDTMRLALGRAYLELG
jgi:glyoxylase-like metal-dependent hydrolase (beta-lactamase superfamily II)